MARRPPASFNGFLTFAGIATFAGGALFLVLGRQSTVAETEDVVDAEVPDSLASG